MIAFSKLKSSDIKKVSKLLAKKEVLLQKIAGINSKLDRLDGESVPKKAAGKTRGPKRGSRRGKLKEAILSALKAAGKKGHSVTELAASLKIKPANIYTWFYTTGKKIAGLKKSKDGRYSL